MVPPGSRFFPDQLDPFRSFRACQVVLSPADVDTASIDASNAVEHRDVAAKVMDMPMLDVESSTTWARLGWWKVTFLIC